MTVTVTTKSGVSFEQTISNGFARLDVDRSAKDGGLGALPTPFEILYGAWGACTNMTIQVYARRKSWPVHRVETTLQDVTEGNSARVEKTIQVWGDLNDEQMQHLKVVAEKCPINRLIMQQREPLSVHCQIERMPN